MFKLSLVSLFLLIFTILLMNCQDATMPEEISNSTQTGAHSFSKATVVKTTFIDEGYWEAWGECLGEMLGITYRENISTQTILDGHGGYHMIMQVRPLDPYIAVGLTSGRQWSPVGHFAMIEHTGNVGQVSTMAGCYNWKSQQIGEPNLTEPWEIHFTVNANGEVTANKEHIRFICN